MGRGCLCDSVTELIRTRAAGRPERIKRQEELKGKRRRVAQSIGLGGADPLSR